MECPYCKIKMQKGEIVGDRAGLNFISNEARKRFGIFPESIKLKGIWDGNLPCYFCESCSKIIIDVSGK